MRSFFVWGAIAFSWAVAAQADDDALASKFQQLVGNTDPSQETWSLHGQATEVIQGYPSFPSAYNGQNSLSPQSQVTNTTTATLFLGRRLWEGAEVYFNPELYEGKGVSSTYGMAGFPNGEAQKNGSWDFGYGDARLFLRQVIGLGGATEHIDADQNQLAGMEDISRVTLTAGKFSATDIFDNNTYSHDPRGQFFNWALMDSAAWDYPANTRGYTQGFAVELNQEHWALRYGAFLVPMTPNSNDLTFHGFNNLGQVIELEERYKLGSNPGKARFLAFLNRDRGADFADALALGDDINTAMAEQRQWGDNKYGFAVNLEQQVMENVGAFARLSWNNGATEDFMFTQIDESLAGGVSLDGKMWGRPEDVIGIGGAVNGVSSEQRKALEDGYYGIMLGDGTLSYSPEAIFETYYAFHFLQYATLSPDYQFALNPGYNTDRGPVNIFAVRLHLQF